MPELPEVEHIAAYLRPRLLGRRVGGTAVHDPRVCPDPSAANHLVGQSILACDRVGKWIVLKLASQVVKIHLKMSGKLWLIPAAQGIAPEAGIRHPRWHLVLQDPRGENSEDWLVLDDQRRFARVKFLAEKDFANEVAGLGLDPLSPAFTVEFLRATINCRRARVKGFLLDQRRLAGIGNIYADEICFAAGIHPASRIEELSDAQIQGLHRAIVDVMRSAVAERDLERPPDQLRAGASERGATAALRLSVYGRSGEPCPRCGRPLRRMILVGRGTCFCENCQRQVEAIVTEL